MGANRVGPGQLGLCHLRGLVFVVLLCVRLLSLRFLCFVELGQWKKCCIDGSLEVLVA